MADISSESSAIAKRAGIKDWLFNPFVFVAGSISLLLGLVAILLAGYIGSLSNTHFDGVLDMHSGAPALLGKFLAEGIINWLSLAIVLYIVGRIISKSSFRAVDLFGTQALARWPTVILAVGIMAPPCQRLVKALMPMASNPGASIQAATMDIILSSMVALVMLLALVLMVALMYRSFSLCSNIKGGKAAAAFIIGLVIAEIVSKIAIANVLPAPPIDISKPAQQFVSQLAKGDFSNATKSFDATMTQAMPADKLAEAWKSLTTQMGAFQKQLGARSAVEQGFIVAHVKCQFDKGAIDVKVVFNNSQQISGLWFTPSQ